MNTVILTFIEILNVSLLIFLSIISYKIYQKTKKIDPTNFETKINNTIDKINSIDTILKKLNL